MLTCSLGAAELRPLEPWNAAELGAFMRRSGADLYEWLAWEKYEDDEACRAFLASFAEGAAADQRRIFGIWLDARLVGGTLFPTFNARTGIAEIGVWLAAEARGRGIVTRAVEAMVEWCFEARGMHRLEWRCAPGNAPSRAIAERLGFTREGTLREAFVVRDRRVDLEMWSLLRTDR